MALIISFVNKSGLADVSDYEVGVWINEHPIAGPFLVTGHYRADGWLELVKKFVNDHETGKLELSKSQQKRIKIQTQARGEKK